MTDPLKRPVPPADLGLMPADGNIRNFAPAPKVLEWIRATIIDPEGALYNEEHAHLEHCRLGVLWASSGFKKQMRLVIGMAEQVAFRTSGWSRWRQEEQLRQWFGFNYPEFIITLDAAYSRECGDVEWCALVEHELYHIAQALDEFGAPRFTQEGLPKFAIRGHDVEEFIGVVERYGVGPKDGPVARMVAAAKKKPRVPHFTAAHACGTCIERVA